MLKVEMIGNLGADAEVRESNGKKFIVARVAHSDRWTDERGQEHDNTVWVDLIMNIEREKLLPYLKEGQKVFVRGNLSLRVYSSKKDRCMKPGATINVTEFEFCGARPDDVPRQLIVPDTGQVVDVVKYYQCNYDTSKFKKEETQELITQNGRRYVCVKGGWVQPMSEDSGTAENDAADANK